jgi:GAF domain-containing protein
MFSKLTRKGEQAKPATIFSTMGTRRKKCKTASINPVPVLTVEGQDAPVELDASMLDYTSVEEFLRPYRTSFSSMPQQWQLMVYLATQLKGCRALLAVSSYLSAELNLGEIIDKILDSGYFVLNADRVSLYEVDHKTRELVLTHTRDGEISNNRIPLGRGIAGTAVLIARSPLSAYLIAGEVALRNKSVNSCDAYKDPRFFSGWDEKTGYRTQTVLAYPICFDGKVHAVLQAINKHDGEAFSVFDQNDEIMCGYLAAQAAIALKNAHMYQVSNGERERAEVMTSLVYKMSEEVDVGRILERLMESMYSALGVDRISVFMYEKDTNELVCYASRDAKGVRIGASEGIVGTAFSEMRIVNVSDVSQDIRFSSSVDSRLGYRTENILAAPIGYRGRKPLGVLAAVNKKTGPVFTVRDEDCVQSICKQAAIALENCSRNAAGLGSSSLPESLTALLCTLLHYQQFNELIPRFVDAAKQVIQGVDVSFFWYDKAASVLRYFSERTVDDTLHRPWQCNSEASLAPEILQAAKENKVKQCDFDVPVLSVIPGIGVASVVAVPVAVADKVIGVLVVSREKPDQHFSIAEKELLCFFASKAMAAFANALAHHSALYRCNMARAALAREKNYMITLDEDGSIIASNKPLEDIFGVHHPIQGDYRMWLGDGSELLVRDIDSAYVTGTSSSQSVTLHTAAHPNGLLVAYTVVPISDDAPQRKNSWFDNPRTSHRKRVAPAGVLLQIEVSADSTLTRIEQRVQMMALDLGATSPVGLASIDGALNSMLDLLKMISLKFDVAWELQQSLGSVDKSIRSVLETIPTARGSTDMSTSDRSGPHAMAHRSMSIVRADMQALVDSYEVHQWDFDVLEIDTTQALRVILLSIFQDFVALQTIPQGVDTLNRFIFQVEKNYRENPFHNFRHACCVVHMTFMITQSCAGDLNSDLQKYGLLLAALCHDLDHPGNTNAFEINSGSQLAVTYNDQHVLENHHCSTAFILMRKPKADMLGSLSRDDYKEVRKLIVSCILATDMAMHFQLLEEFNVKLEKGLDWNMVSELEQHFVAKMVLHAADLSNPTRPFNISSAWAVKIAQEFNNQVRTACFALLRRFDCHGAVVLKGGSAGLACAWIHDHE